MSYEGITPTYYTTYQQGTPFHAGARGWMSAPFPGWGENPNLAGRRRLATDGLGNLILTDPVVTTPIGAMDEARKRQLMWLAWAAVGAGLLYLGTRRGGFLRTMARNSRSGEREQAVRSLAGRSPYVGEPATYHIGSDDYAGEVVRVSPSGKSVWVKYGSRGTVQKFNLRGDHYRAAGRGGGSVTLGRAETRLDPSF